MAQVSYGTITITDTTDIERIYMVYAGSESNITPPDVDNFTLWKTDITQTSGTYIWQRAVVKKSGIEITAANFQQFYGEPVCITGEGGRSIKSIISYYCNYGIGTPDENYSGWKIDTPEYDEDKPNYWVKTVIIYVDDSETEFESNGSIVTIEDGEHKQVTSFSVELSPIQSLNGYDKPWSGGCGANKWDEEWEQGIISWTGKNADDGSTRIRSKNFVPCVAGNEYRVVTSDNLQFLYYDSNKAFVSYEPSSMRDGATITIPTGVAYFRFYTYDTSYGATYKNDIAINYPSSVTTYSPYSNECPITGRTECVTERTGANLWDSSGQPSVRGDDYNGWHIGSFTNGISVKLFDKNNGASVSGVYFGITNNGRNATDGVTWALANGNVLSSEIHRNAEYVSIYPKTAEALTKLLNRYDVIVTIWNGSYPTKYEPYNGDTYTTTLGRTVYGGEVEVVGGDLTDKMAMVDLGSLTYSYVNTGFMQSSAPLADAKAPPTTAITANIICSALEAKSAFDVYAGANGIGMTDNQLLRIKMDGMGTDPIAFKSAMSGVQLCYELATPQTYSLTGQEVELISGQNNVWSDEGDVEVSGFTIVDRDIQIHLDNGLTNALAKSADAQSKATEALGKANEATQAVALMGGHFIYKSSSSGNSTPAGAGVIQNIADNPANWGYNTWIGSNGIQLRRGETADATLSTNGLVLSKGGIEAGTSGENGYIYLSTEDYPLQEYQLTSDIILDDEKTYYILNEDRYVEVTEPNVSDISTYYEISQSGITINNYTPTKINNENSDYAWREIIGTKFGVDSEGNLYANNAHLSNAEVEGAITATSLTIGGSGSSYDGVAAINISGYSIEITSDSTEVSDAVTTTYLYPHLYHNGIEVTTGIDYSHFIWYKDNETTGTEGDENNYGRYLATYEHSYRVIYEFDDGEVGGASEIQTREVDPQKYITQINEYGIKIHPEVWTNQSSYIQLDGTGMELFDSSGDSIAKYGSTARIGKLNNSRFLINSNSLQAYSGTNSSPYFEVSANGLSWGSNTAATTAEVNVAAQTASNYIALGITGIMVYDGHNGVQSADNPSSTTNNVFIDANSLNIRKGTLALATFGADKVVIGQNAQSHIEQDYHSFQMIGKENNVYLHISDLQDINGYVTDTFIGDGVTGDFYLTFFCEDTNDYIVTIDGIINTNCHIYSPSGAFSFLEFYEDMQPNLGEEIIIKYKTSNAYAYTLGTRNNTTPIGKYSSVIGENLGANGNHQTVIGKYNKIETLDWNYPEEHKVFIIGNGTSSARSNALTVDWSGNVWCAGGITATPTAITPTFSQCTSGNYTRCYRIGNIVFLSFNINVTTSTSNYDYITGLPTAIGGGWATNSSISGVASPSTRWFITTNGTLCSDGAPTVGWHDGSIVYICQ